MSLAAELTARAASTLDHAIAWYEAERAGMGVKLVADLESTLALLCSLPNLGRPAVNTRGRSRARVWRLRRFPYRVVYEVRGDRLVVLRLEHMRRRIQS